MRYGLDPRFRFTVSRAIYKGMLQFLCSQYNMDYVVQPLPVDHMALRMTSENEVELTWQPVADALEPTAVAEKYIVYTRIGDGDFDNGVLVDATVTEPRSPPAWYAATRLPLSTRAVKVSLPKFFLPDEHSIPKVPYW